MPYVEKITGWIDKGLNEKAYIIPGLGDFGERRYVLRALRASLTHYMELDDSTINLPCFSHTSSQLLSLIPHSAQSDDSQDCALGFTCKRASLFRASIWIAFLDHSTVANASTSKRANVICFFQIALCTYVYTQTHIHIHTDIYSLLFPCYITRYVPIAYHQI